MEILHYNGGGTLNVNVWLYNSGIVVCYFFLNQLFLVLAKLYACLKPVIFPDRKYQQPKKVVYTKTKASLTVDYASSFLPLKRLIRSGQSHNEEETALKIYAQSVESFRRNAMRSIKLYWSIIGSVIPDERLIRPGSPFLSDNPMIKRRLPWKLKLNRSSRLGGVRWHTHRKTFYCYISTDSTRSILGILARIKGGMVRQTFIGS